MPRFQVRGDEASLNVLQRTAQAEASGLVDNAQRQERQSIRYGESACYMMRRRLDRDGQGAVT